MLLNQHSIKGRDCRAWLVPEDRACNLDTLFDWFIAEQMLLYHGLA